MFNDAVSVISTATNTVTTTVTVGTEPFGAVVTPNGEYAYVTNSGTNSVSVISAATKSAPSFSIVDLSILVIVIIIVLFLIILAWNRRRKKKIQPT